MSCEPAIVATRMSLLYLCPPSLKFLRRKSDYFALQKIGFLFKRPNVLRDRHSRGQLCWPLGRFGSARRSSHATPSASDLGSRSFRGQLNQIPKLHPRRLDNGPPRWSGTSHCHLCPISGRIFKRIARLPRHKFERTWSGIRPLLWEPVR